jgi:hypothetical protein
MDASHKEWFAGLLDQFDGAIQRDDFVSAETIDAVQCMRVISAAYASARRGSREMPIGETQVLERSNARERVQRPSFGRTTART